MSPSNFIFDPVSLVICKDKMPSEMEEVGVEIDDVRKALPFVDFSARYLHERVHWIQHFSTFSGLLTLLRVEMQTSVTMQYLSSFADDIVDIFPLRTKFSTDKAVESWNGLELLDAALCGERSRRHFEGSYGSDWTKNIRSAIQIFSRTAYCLPETRFEWPKLNELETKKPLHVRRISLVDDGDGFANGAATIAEIHAWSAQILKLSNFLERSSDFVVATEQMISERASKLRKAFYERAGLVDGWQSEVICSQAAFYALNAPVALFFPPPEAEKEDFMQIAPVAHFLSFAGKIANAPLKLEADVPQDPEAFIKWSKVYLDRLIGFDLFEYNLRLLEIFSASASYTAASSEKMESAQLDGDFRLSFVGSWVSAMVKAARSEPMFVMCPGHLYELKRSRFQELFGAMGNFIEWTEGIGYAPAPYFSRGMVPAEYSRHVAFAVQADIARAMMVKDRPGLDGLLATYTQCHPHFRELHLIGVHIGLRSLCMPNTLYLQLRDQVPLPESWRIDKSH